MSASKARHTESSDPHWIEWISGISSCVLVGAMIGWIAWQAITANDEPPQLSTTITQVRKSGSTFRVEFDIVNSAPVTAAGVTVMGEIIDATAAVETAEVTFDYVPAQSKSRGALLFSTDPEGRDLRVRPSGYTEP